MKTQNLPSAAAKELAKIKAYHGDLHRRLAELEARGQPEHHVAGALAADFDGLIQAIGRWIARQDTKSASR